MARPTFAQPASVSSHRIATRAAESASARSARPTGCRWAGSCRELICGFPGITGQARRRTPRYEP